MFVLTNWGPLGAVWSVAGSILTAGRDFNGLWWPRERMRTDKFAPLQHCATFAPDRPRLSAEKVAPPDLFAYPTSLTSLIDWSSAARDWQALVAQGRARSLLPTPISHWPLLPDQPQTITAAKVVDSDELDLGIANGQRRPRRRRRRRFNRRS